MTASVQMTLIICITLIAITAIGKWKGGAK